MRRDIALWGIFGGGMLMVASIIVGTPDGYVVLCGVGGIAWCLGVWWLLKQKDTLLQHLLQKVAKKG